MGVATSSDELDLTIPAERRVELANARHLANCAPDARPGFERLEREALRFGRPIAWVQSIRYDADQLKLYGQGRKLVNGRWAVVAADLVVTNAMTARDSAHGCICGIKHPPDDGCARAVDACFLIEGRIVGPRPGKGNDSWDADLPWEWLGKLGESLDLQWGGRFPFADLGHFQQKNWRALRDADVRARRARTA